MSTIYSILNETHLDRLVELNHVVFHISDHYSRKYLEQFCVAGVGLVAIEGDTLIGFILYCDTLSSQPFGKENEKSITIFSLGVDETRRRLGIGKTLLRMVIEQSYLPLYLHVRISNKIAQNLYESMGFKIVDVYADYYISVNDDNKKESMIYMHRSNL